MAKKTDQSRRRKLRDSFLAGEPDALKDEAILELILNYAIQRKDLRPLSQDLIRAFTDLNGVISADFKSLCKINGIKAHTAALIKLVGYIKSPEPFEFIPDTASSKRATTLQQKLIEPSQGGKSNTEPVPGVIRSKPRKGGPKPKTDVFTNSVLKEAIEILPKLPDTENLAEIRAFLYENLPFSSTNTRERYVPYIVNRLFPEGRADKALRSFARRYAGRQELRDVCFYRFCKAEPLMYAVYEDLLAPGLGFGHLDRQKLREYLARRYPESKGTDHCAIAIVNALTTGGIAESNRTSISISYREPLISSMAFIIHSEFPEPGMYEISKVEENLAMKAMLWNPDRLYPGLYELRNRGILAKVSEIDRFKQFTTKYTLEELCDKLYEGGTGEKVQALL